MDEQEQNVNKRRTSIGFVDKNRVIHTRKILDPSIVSSGDLSIVKSFDGEIRTIKLTCTTILARP